MVCKSLFVTATGTDIGKTYISALIVKKMRELGLDCGYFKPALSGAVVGTVSDLEYVRNVANLQNDKTCVSYLFEEAVSPHLAAKRCGVSISMAKILEDYSNLLKHMDYMVVEGAGGITCPFNLSEEKLLLPDVIKKLDIGVLLVADGGLGTINSVILTIEYAKVQGINIKGIILNNFDKNNFMHMDNLEQIETLTGVKVVATVKNNDTEICIDDEILKGLFE